MGLIGKQGRGAQGGLRAVVGPRWPESPRAKQSAEERTDPATAPGEAGTHLGELPELVGVQQQLLQAAGIAVDLLGDVDQRAVALVDGLHMTVAPPQGNAVEHRRLHHQSRVPPSRGARGSEPAPPGRPAAPRPPPAPSSLLAPSSLAPRKDSTVPNVLRKPREPSPRPAPSPQSRASPPTAPSAALRFLLAAAAHWACALGGTRRACPGRGCSAPGFPGDPAPGRVGRRCSCGPLLRGESHSVRFWREPRPKKLLRRAGTEGQKEQNNFGVFILLTVLFFFLLPFPKTTFSSGVRKYRPAEYLERGVMKESVLAFRHPLLLTPVCALCLRTLAGRPYDLRASLVSRTYLRCTCHQLPGANKSMDVRLQKSSKRCSEKKGDGKGALQH